MLFEFQIHKYKNGHQLVASTIELERTDQDTIDRLSDISGQLRPGELFRPYLTCYPVPSEKYFVIAKTWQDLSAPRAGCVLTKSIIFQMKDWEVSPMVSSYFLALKGSDFDLNFPIIKIPNSRVLIQPISDAPVEELVEAMFLEQRKPILLFECTEAEQIIIRLYTALWPTIRRKFATCTFAMAPRSIDNRPFDLLFSNNKMRTRFSDWTGRRIEGETSNRKNARHRWTKELTERIFKSVEANLYNKSNTSIFDYVQIIDESTLRLNLLWEELLYKVKYESSPMAILGLLDIINSQPVFAETLYKSIEEHIRVAVKEASKKLEPIEAWKFYAGLLVKHKRKLMGREIFLQVKAACTRLTLAEPEISIEFISVFSPSSTSIPSVLYASIGDGLAKIFQDNHSTLIEKIPPVLGIYFVATSLDYSKSIMSLIHTDDNSLSATLESYLSSPNQKILQRAKINLMNFINTPAHIPIVKLLFNKASIEQFNRILNIVAENTRFVFHEFNEVLLKPVIKFKAFEELMNLIITYAENENGENLLMELFVLRPEIMGNYLTNSLISDDHRNRVVCKTINRFSKSSLIDLAKNKNIAIDLLPIIVNNKNCKREKVAAFILNASIPVGEAISGFVKLPASTINSVDPEELFSLIQKSLGKLKPNSTLALLKKLDQSQSDYLILRYFDLEKDIPNIKIVFETLMNASAPLRKSMTNHIDIVSGTLAKQLPDNIDNQIADSWIDLLLSTNESDKRRKAAFAMLGYIYGTQNTDPTKLISASFPIVYDTFLQGKGLAKTLTYWVFSDWDKCRTLRYDLAERYLRSDWPSLGLFQVAKKAGILNDIIYILSNSKQGKKYMESAYDEIIETQPVDKTIIKQLKKHIKKK